MLKLPDVTPPFQTGVIDIGAHTVRLDIYELDRLWRMRPLETLSRQLNLGADVFRNGFVSAENIEKLLFIVENYKAKLAEYGAKEFRVIATSAVREAFNKELIADRFRGKGLELEILEGTHEAALTFQAAREVLLAQKDKPLAVSVLLIIGTGSLFVIGVADGLMRFCEELPVGTARVSDAGNGDLYPLEQLREMLKSQRLLRRLDECVHLPKSKEVTLVILGTPARRLAEFAGRSPAEENDCTRFTAKEFTKVLESCGERNKKNVKPHDAEAEAELAGAAVIVRHFFESLACKEVLCPGITTRSSLIRDWLRRCRGIEEEPFRADLAALCSAIGSKYGFDARHAGSVAAASARLYNKLRRFFAFPEHSALLLEAAARLHDIGRFVDARHHHRHSWYLISNTQLPGLSESEHRIVAAMARYHGKALPSAGAPEYEALSSDEKIALLKLVSLLRVADALDVRRNDRLADFKPVLHGRTLLLQSSAADLEMEKYSLKLKGGLLEQVFGLELKLESCL